MKKFLLSFALLSFFAVSCQKDNEGNSGITSPVNMQEFIVTLNCPNADTLEVATSTRMSVIPGASYYDDWEVSWEDVDEVSAWYYSNSTNSGIQKFTVSELLEDGQRADFAGEFDTNLTNVEVRFVYPYDKDALDTTSGLYTIDVSNQTVDMDYSENETSSQHMHYGDNNMYMISNLFDITSTEDYPTLTMSHLLAAVELAITAKDDNAKYTPAKVEITGLTSGGTLNFSTGTIQNSKNETITLNIENLTSELSLSDESIFPFSAAPAVMGDVSILVIFENGKSFKKTYTGTNGITMLAGLHYKIIMVVDNDYVGYHLSNLSASNYPAGESTWEIMDTTASSDAEFAGLKAALNELSSPVSLEFPYLTTVPASAFESLKNVDSLTLDAVTYIGGSAFCEDSSLEYLELNGANITHINSSCFGPNIDTNSIKLVINNVDENSTIYSILDNVLTINGKTSYEFYSINGVTKSVPTSLSQFSATSYPETTSWVIYDTTATTDDYAGLKAALAAANDDSIELIFPNLTTLASSAFIDCEYVYAVEMSKVTTVEANAFNNCKNIKEIVLPMVESIGDLAFALCPSLQSLTLGTSGSGVSSFGENVFQTNSVAGVTLKIKIASSDISIDGSELTYEYDSNSYINTFSSIISY